MPPDSTDHGHTLRGVIAGDDHQVQPHRQPKDTFSHSAAVRASEGHLGQDANALPLPHFRGCRLYAARVETSHPVYKFPDADAHQLPTSK
jgi:hypothetical protein